MQPPTPSASAVAAARRPAAPSPRTAGLAARSEARPRVVLVTGASSGIGAAVARRLARARGYELLLNGRDNTRLAEVARQTGGLALPGDLTGGQVGERGEVGEDGEGVAARATAVAGRVDVLVACAGVGWCGSFTRMPWEAVEEMVAVNLVAPIRLARHLVPAMTRHGSGHLVLLASIAGTVGVGREVVYSATKAALRAFAEALRYEVEGSGVRISVVVPAAVDTALLARRGVPYTRRYPRVVPPERVAEAVYRVLRHPRDEVYVPRWMRLPTTLHGSVPALYRVLARRFG